MARTKRKNLAAITAMRKSPPEQADFEQQLPDSGPDVEVRKQRLLILIPPLPSKQNQGKGKRNATVELGNGTAVEQQKLAKKRKLMPTEMALAVMRPAAGSTSHKNAALSRGSPAKGSYSIKSVPERKHPFPGTRAFPAQSFGFAKLPLQHSSSQLQTQLGGSLQCQAAAATGRANFFKRRLERIGGLSLWLRSQGLGQFARIFQELKIDESGLVDFTMDALKRIGVTPVGPRRKLIWAIDQICNG